MDAKRLKDWVTALQAIRTAAGPAQMRDSQLRSWAIQTLAGISSTTLDPSDLHEITDAFLESDRNTKSSTDTNLVTYQNDQTGFLFRPAKEEAYSIFRWLEQTASPYPVTGTADQLSTASLVYPYSLPRTYLEHPVIDVLDQETITKIATRDTGA